MAVPAGSGGGGPDPRHGRCFAGVARAPLTAVIILSETTASRGLMLPMFAAAFIADWASQQVCREKLCHGLAATFAPPPGDSIAAGIRDRRRYGAGMTTTLYGIPNCDTVKKARTWLDEVAIPYAFHDYKKAGIDEATLRGWVDRLGWEAVLNRAGTTFRKLPDADKAGLDADKAVALMLAQPSMIKRPMLVHGDVLEAGFKPDRYAALL